MMTPLFNVVTRIGMIKTFHLNMVSCALIYHVQMAQSTPGLTLTNLDSQADVNDFDSAHLPLCDSRVDHKMGNGRAFILASRFGLVEYMQQWSNLEFPTKIYNRHYLRQLNIVQSNLSFG